MAKQRVNVIEQHVEKAAVGIAGLFFLAVAFLYLVQTPTYVEDGGQKYGPGEFDKEVLRQEAESLKSSLNRTPQPLADMEDYEQDFKRVLQNPLQYVSATPELPAPTPQRPPVPAAFGNRPVEPGQIRLARVVAPAKPVAYGGKTTFYLYPQRPINEDPDAVTSEDQEILASLEKEEDRSWVTVAAVVDIEAQRKEFRRNHYDRDLQGFLIAGVEVQRQRLSPFGKWSAWETINPWAPYQKVAMPEVVLTRSGEQWMPARGATEAVADYRELIDIYQCDLRQPYPPQEVIGDRWRLPWLPEINWDTVDVEPADVAQGMANEYIEQLPRPLDPSAQKDGKKEGKLSASELRRAAARDLKNAEKLSAGNSLNELYEAEDLCRAILKNKYAANRIKDKAQKLLARIELRIEELEREQSQEALEREREQADQDILPTLAPTLEKTVVWAHDLDMETGHTYRYRLRLALFNAYVGNYEKLLDADAAKSLVLMGEWSPPTDPIPVKPDMGFFVTSAKPDEAKIEIFKWVRGFVANRKVTVPLGGRITCQDFVQLPKSAEGKKRIAVDFDTGYTLLAADPAKAIRVPQSDSQGTSYKEDTTPAAVCMDSRGRVIELSKQGNSALYKQWTKEFKERGAE